MEAQHEAGKLLAISLSALPQVLIQAVNEADPQVAMVFTGQRAFRH